MENNSIPSPIVAYVLVNNLGGITTMLNNVIVYRQEDALPQKAFFLDIRENRSTKFMDDFGGGIPAVHFGFSKKENWYSVYARLARLLDAEGGVLIANDVFEMIMLSRFNIRKKVVQMIHDAYNVKLAVQYGVVADAFICHSVFYYEVMQQLFPERRNDIYHIPYGIPLPGYRRTAAEAGRPLKLVFVGRHDPMKGIYDLFGIGKLLEDQGIAVDWLIMGRGPETEKLKQQWASSPHARFITPDTNEEVLKLLAERDVLVFPTKFEGFPVALLEAMSVGCVPVASDLPGGLRELVKNEVNGFLSPMNDQAAFAERIAYLDNNRQALEQMSINARTEVVSGFNAALQSPKYQQLFTSIALSAGPPRHHRLRQKLGSKLDHPWIPNIITTYIRSLK